MPRQKITFDTVRLIGLALPDVEDGTAYGSPALKIRGQLMAVVPTHRSAEPNSVAVRIPFDQRDELLAEEPDVYYVKPHYEDYAVVLVRMPGIHLDALRDLLEMSWQFVSSKPRVRKRKPTGRRERR
ncbi:MAG: MmcQ/YjbR family DNA-binding protein [Vicinamibacterales bacterium]